MAWLQKVDYILYTGIEASWIPVTCVISFSLPSTSASGNKNNNTLIPGFNYNLGMGDTSTKISIPILMYWDHIIFYGKEVYLS